MAANISRSFAGASSSSDNLIVTFDGTTGKLVKATSGISANSSVIQAVGAASVVDVILRPKGRGAIVLGPDYDGAGDDAGVPIRWGRSGGAMYDLSYNTGFYGIPGVRRSHLSYFGYNMAQTNTTRVPNEPTYQIGFESCYDTTPLGPGDISTEHYLAWMDPVDDTWAPRPFQYNVTWPSSFAANPANYAAGKFSGYTTLALLTNEFAISAYSNKPSAGGVLSQFVRITSSLFRVTRPVELTSTLSVSGALTSASSTESTWTAGHFINSPAARVRIDAGSSAYIEIEREIGGATYLEAASSANRRMRLGIGTPSGASYGLGLIGASLSDIQNWSIWTSSDNLSTSTPFFVVFGQGRRIGIGDSIDDPGSGNLLAVRGGTIINRSTAGTVGFLVKPDAVPWNVITLSAGSSSGGHLELRRASAEFIKIVAARGDTDAFSLNNAFAVLWGHGAGGVLRTIDWRWSTDGSTAPNVFCTFDPSNSRLNLGSGIHLAINGTQVVGPRGAAVADASGGSTIDTEARAQLNTLLARLRAHGLIAT